MTDDQTIATRAFPIVLIMLDIGAAIVYGAALDWRRAIYWLAAGVLTACVTF